ncbi:MAG: CDP-alcohol phosphatidyltransferase family protein [Terriglobia bacterium]
MRRQFFTFANQLSLLRLLLIPFFVVLVLGARYGWALALLLVAGASDLRDGMLARWLEQRTPLGAYLDPVADKLLLSSAFVALAIQAQVPWTLTILVLSRDILIIVVALVIILGAGFFPMPPSRFGKACTLAQVITVLVVVVAAWRPAGMLLTAKEALLWLTGVLTVLSGVHYAYRIGKILPELPPKP